MFLLSEKVKFFCLVFFVENRFLCSLIFENWKLSESRMAGDIGTEPLIDWYPLLFRGVSGSRIFVTTVFGRLLSEGSRMIFSGPTSKLSD